MTSGEPICPRCGNAMTSGINHLNCQPRPPLVDPDLVRWSQLVSNPCEGCEVVARVGALERVAETAKQLQEVRGYCAALDYVRAPLSEQQEASVELAKAEEELAAALAALPKEASE